MMKGIVLIAASILLSGCHAVMFNPAGAIAHQQEKLIIISTILMLSVVIPVIVLTLVFAWKYRASNTHSKYAPNWSHSTLLEAIWWAIPCVIILILAILTWISSHKLDPYRPIDSQKKPLVIEVISLNWKWLFIYPKQNIATVNYLQIPKNQPIAFKITSDAPMNSFWIPQLGSQIMSMPGMETQLHMLGTKIGNYKGYSANYSGRGFSDMVFDVKVSSAQDFASWVKKVQRSPHRLTKKVYVSLAKPSSDQPVMWYSSVQKDLFSDVIMKYMMPKKAINQQVGMN